MVRPGDDIVAGIRVLDTAGHTPGHVSFGVEGDGGLIVVGDVAGLPAVVFPHLEWPLGFDAIPDLSVANRKALLQRAAADQIKMAGFHWPYPGGFAEALTSCRGRASRSSSVIFIGLRTRPSITRDRGRIAGYSQAGDRDRKPQPALNRFWRCEAEERAVLLHLAGAGFYAAQGSVWCWGMNQTANIRAPSSWAIAPDPGGSGA